MHIYTCPLLFASPPHASEQFEGEIGTIAVEQAKNARLRAAHHVDEPSKPDRDADARLGPRSQGSPRVSAEICGRSPKVSLENMRHHDWRKEFVNSNRDECSRARRPGSDEEADPAEGEDLDCRLSLRVGSNDYENARPF